MASNILVWDLETVPDLEGYARANNLIGRSRDGIRSAMGDDFPKLIYHSIICIGALVASRTANGYEVEGGALIIAEKTLAETARLRDALTFPYYDYKLERGFTPEHILDKERSLRGQMTLWTEAELKAASAMWVSATREAVSPAGTNNL